MKTDFRAWDVWTGKKVWVSVLTSTKFEHSGKVTERL